MQHFSLRCSRLRGFRLDYANYAKFDGIMPLLFCGSVLLTSALTILKRAATDSSDPGRACQ
jgi:hypothetical protein